MGAVGQHRPPPAVVAHQIARGQEQLPWGREADLVNFAEEAGVAVHDFGWQEPALEQESRPVQVGQDEIEQFRPLDEPRLERRPLRRLEDQRDRVEVPRLLDGRGKPPIGDAVVGKQSLQGSPAFHESTRAEPVDRNAEIPPGRAQLGRRSDHFVPGDGIGGSPRVSSQQCAIRGGRRRPAHGRERFARRTSTTEVHERATPKRETCGRLHDNRPEET